MQKQTQKRIYLTPDEVPYLIGPRGETVNNIRRISEAKVRFDKESDQDYAEIKGSNAAILKAVQLIQEKRDTFKRSVPAIYQPKEPLNAQFSAQIELPVGASRFYQGAGRAVFKENAQYVRVEKTYLIIKCPSQQILDQTVQEIKQKVSNFACVAIPAPVWAVGRIIGRQGDGIIKINNQVNQLTGGTCLVFFPDVGQSDGILSYAIVSSDDYKATQACCNVIISRLAAITEQGGVICDMFPSYQFTLRQIQLQSFHCQIYLMRLQSSQNVKIKILDGDYFVQSFLSQEIIASTPLYLPNIVDQKQQILDPEKPDLYVPLPLVLDTIKTIQTTEVPHLFLPNHISFPVSKFPPPSNLTNQQPVDRKFLVVSAGSEDLESAEFWKNLSYQAFNQLSTQFFTTDSSIIDFCDIEFQAFPGRSVLMPKSNQTASSHSELSESLQKRDLTSRFIAGVENIYYNQLLKSSQLIHYWRVNLCQNLKICGNQEIWTRIQIEKHVGVLNRPVQQSDLEGIIDFPEKVQVSRRAICVQIMVHLNGFVDGKKNDLLVLLKTRPRHNNCERFEEYLKKIEELSSQDAFVSQSSFEDEDEEIRYGIASLPLPQFKQPDIFEINEEMNQQSESICAGPISGLYAPNKATKGQFISSVDLCLEQSTATLVECRYKFHKNLAIQHSDIVDFGGNNGSKKKFVLCLQPNFGTYWGCEGVRNVGFDAREQDYGEKLRDFVQECIEVVQ
ncbi:KH domain-containing protein [Spironucleus salmonicida]|uniref:KH domain-containing protein n=1 Tax=Spironucleus salmonicida TaxID=348837 RepID=V6LE74_9EUKA|nr:KH domain-containing protein [Spironucleus salmonicida]|eukprot:EST42578.1 KH domain-containing protein [Spironucleus salmonicida]